MQLQKVSRSRAKIKLGLQGPSGSGKTFSALLLAYGLVGDWTKIAVIDSESQSASLYADLGQYYHISLESPFTPERYIEAIRLCVSSGMEAVIIDSISHEWDSSGGILDVHANMLGNSFTNWAKLTPRHNALIQEILQSPVHVIATIRSKQDYVLSEKNGKMVPEKVGMKGITRDGLDYEFTLVFDLDIKHNATASKDRTSLFTDKPEFRINSETGRKILEWCLRGVERSTSIEGRINDCKSIGELLQLYLHTPEFQPKYADAFTKRRHELQKTVNNLSPIKSSDNGNAPGQPST